MFLLNIHDSQLHQKLAYKNKKTSTEHTHAWGENLIPSSAIIHLDVGKFSCLFLNCSDGSFMWNKHSCIHFETLISFPETGVVIEFKRQVTAVTLYPVFTLCLMVAESLKKWLIFLLKTGVASEPFLLTRNCKITYEALSPRLDTKFRL